MKEALLKFFFEEVKVARVCLLPKALAVSKLFDLRTCIVVDSGATSTSVWVVVDGKVDETKTQTISVGGWHVSQFLKQALTWKDHQDAAGVSSCPFHRFHCIDIAFCAPKSGDHFEFRHVGSQAKVPTFPQFESRERFNWPSIQTSTRDASHQIPTRGPSTFRTDRSNTFKRTLPGAGNDVRLTGPSSDG